MKLLLLRTDLACFFLSPLLPWIPCSRSPLGRSFCICPLAGFVWENVRDQKVLSRAGWSWTVELRDWVAGWVGLEPWQAEAGSEASAVAAARPLKKQNRAREWEQSRRKTALEKTASQTENKLREQEATDQNGKPPGRKRKWNQERNDLFSFQLKQSLLLFPFWGVPVWSKVLPELNKSSSFFPEQHDSSINREFWKQREKTLTLKGDNSGETWRAGNNKKGKHLESHQLLNTTLRHAFKDLKACALLLTQQLQIHGLCITHRKLQSRWNPWGWVFGLPSPLLLKNELVIDPWGLRSPEDRRQAALTQFRPLQLELRSNFKDVWICPALLTQNPSIRWRVYRPNDEIVKDCFLPQGIGNFSVCHCMHCIFMNATEFTNNLPLILIFKLDSYGLH